MTIQEKYNEQIYDAANEETIKDLYHTRANVLSPLNISDSDEILLIGSDAKAIKEYLQEKAGDVEVGDAIQSKKFDYIIIFEPLSDTPSSYISFLKESGKVAFIGSEKLTKRLFAKKLFEETGFKNIKVYNLMPDYEFASEIFLDEFKEAENADYLLIAAKN